MKVFLIVMVRLLYLPFTTCTSVVEHYSGTKTCKLNELKVFQFKVFYEIHIDLVNTASYGPDTLQYVKPCLYIIYNSAMCLITELKY